MNRLLLIAFLLIFSQYSSKAHSTQGPSPPPSEAASHAPSPAAHSPAPSKAVAGAPSPVNSKGETHALSPSTSPPPSNTSPPAPPSLSPPTAYPPLPSPSRPLRSNATVLTPSPAPSSAPAPAAGLPSSHSSSPAGSTHRGPVIIDYSSANSLYATASLLLTAIALSAL